MANCYTDATGVMKAKALTPVIQALFGALGVEAIGADDEDASLVLLYIKSEGNEASYGNICSALDEGFDTFEMHTSEEIADVFLNFAEEHGKRNAVLELIDASTFNQDDDADLMFLFDLARLLDDGHGLESISMETGWHGDKMRLGYFGGHGDYVSKNVRVSMGSGFAANFGAKVDAAIGAGDVGAVALAYREHLESMIDDIAIPEVREAVRAQLLRDEPAQVSAPSA